MPWGSILQFRYHKRWIATGVLANREITERRNPLALVAYIDQSDPNRTPEIIPCRFASIVDVTEHGTTVSIQLELKDFAYAEDLTKFNGELQTAAAGSLPAWQANGKLKGDYWLDANPAPTAIIRSANLADWERIVDQLAARHEFKDEGCFYTVVAMNDVASHEAVPVNKQRYEFTPGHEYELQLYHYYPTSVPLVTRLTLTTTSQWLAFTTNPVLSLDSRYDLKRGRFTARKPTTADQAVISVLRDPGGGRLPYLDFDLPVLVRGVFWRTLVYGIILGVLLAGPQIVAALSNPSLPSKNVVLVCVTSGIIGVITGIVAAFGLKKSP
jgi:hypothetical protein